MKLLKNLGLLVVVALIIAGGWALWKHFDTSNISHQYSSPPDIKSLQPPSEGPLSQ